MEQARPFEEEQFRTRTALLDLARDGVLILDLSQRIIFWNKCATELFGASAEEALGCNVQSHMREAGANLIPQIFQHTVAFGEWQGELALTGQGGRKLFVQSRWTLLRDSAGLPESVFILNTDITERKELEEKFLRAQRMESVGALAGGIAHDLNNMLSPILMVVDLLRDRVSDAESQRMLETIRTSAERGSRLIKQILTFAQGLGGEQETIQVKYLLEEITKLVKETFPRAIRIKLAVQDNLASVMGNVTQLHQVVMNLCVNARDSMPRGGQLTIEAQGEMLDNLQPRQLAGPVSGPHVVVRVTDTGTGIPGDLLERIFEPFFTTKEAGKGTGLGLSTVMGIVKAHGGFLEVSSSVGRGTTFSIYLPSVQDGHSSDTDTSKIPAPRGQNELILVVDDEPLLLDSTRTLLEDFNYRVITAADGVEGLALFESRRSEIRMVISDVMMPGMDGPELLRRIQRLNSRVKCVLVSGIDPRTRLFSDRNVRVDAFLAKPFSAETLLLKIRQILKGEAMAPVAIADCPPAG